VPGTPSDSTSGRDSRFESCSGELCYGQPVASCVGSFCMGNARYLDGMGSHLGGSVLRSLYLQMSTMDAHARKLTLCMCPSIANWSPDTLVVKGRHCNHFYLYCCHCAKLGRTPNKESQPCHHYRVIYIDGACKNNGRPEATAGAGIALGTEDSPLGQLSIPITDAEDNFPVRSNQRAELLAAKLGLESLQAHLDQMDGQIACIVATDSEYVVKESRSGC
jgi:hypothetical protein